MRCFLCVFLLVAGLARPACGQASVTQSISVRIAPILALGVADGPAPLMLHLGSGATTADAAFAFTSNLEGVHLAATLDAPMPLGLRLSVEAESRLGRSLGTVELSGVEAATLLDGLGRGAVTGQRLTYRLSGLPQVAGPAVQTRRVRFVLSDPATGITSEAVQVVRFIIPAHR